MGTLGSMVTWWWAEENQTGWWYDTEWWTEIYFSKDCQDRSFWGNDTWSEITMTRLSLWRSGPRAAQTGGTAYKNAVPWGGILCEEERSSVWLECGEQRGNDNRGGGAGLEYVGLVDQGRHSKCFRKPFRMYGIVEHVVFLLLVRNPRIREWV